MGISDKTSTDLGWDQVVEHLAKRTHTARGEARARAIDFFSEPDRACARIAEISEARLLAALEAPMPFGGIKDVSVAIARADKGAVLDNAELIAVADTARGMSRLGAHLRYHESDAPRLAVIARDIADLERLYHIIGDAFDADGRLADHASEELGPLRRKLAGLRSQLERRMGTFVDDSRVSRHLQDRYYTMRDERYVVPVRADARGHVRGIIHGTSQSGQTVFVEPEEIVELGNRVRLAECAVEDEEQRILAALSVHVTQAVEPLSLSLEATTHLDVIAAAGILSDDLDASAPSVSDDRRIELRRARHPLMVLWGRACVPNDIVIEPGTVAIVTGPNAGGKTVAMEIVGLCALMLRAGLHIPADAGSSLPFFEQVHSDIGDSQSLENELSTFSAHLMTLRSFLDVADDRTLLLIDEIAAGTEPEQGACLAQAVLEALAERGTVAMVTTHFERLKALGAGDARFANASVGFDLEAMAPTFQLHLGIPGSSAALFVARRMGLPKRVLERAHELLGERRASIEELLAEVAEERRRLSEERAELARVRAQADQALAQAEVARTAAKEYQRKLEQGAHSDAVAALRRARDELDHLRNAVKKRARVDAISQTEKRISELSSAIAEHAPKRALPAGEAARRDKLTPGTQVYVTSLGSRGEVVDTPQRGRVTVQIGNLKTAVALEELLIERGRERDKKTADERGHASKTQPGGKSRKTGSRPGRTGASSRAITTAHETGPDQPSESEKPASIRTPECTIDVRGERADEAVETVDRFIDQSILGERDIVFVIHGHGTGALRNAVREHLSGHPSVADWRPGERSEGGDGVTVAWLDLE